MNKVIYAIDKDGTPYVACIDGIESTYKLTPLLPTNKQFAAVKYHHQIAERIQTDFHCIEYVFEFAPNDKNILQFIANKIEKLSEAPRQNKNENLETTMKVDIFQTKEGKYYAIDENKTIYWFSYTQEICHTIGNGGDPREMLLNIANRSHIHGSIELNKFEQLLTEHIKELNFVKSGLIKTIDC